MRCFPFIGLKLPSAFGDPAEYARDWAKPAKEADAAGYWRTGDPLEEFGR